MIMAAAVLGFPEWKDFVRIAKYRGRLGPVWGCLDAVSYLLTYPYLYALSYVVSVYYEPRWTDKLVRMAGFLAFLVPPLVLFTSMAIVGSIVIR